MALKDITNINTEYGLLPPQAIDIEEAVLGICLNDKEALLDAVDILHSPEVFYKDVHQKIYKTYLGLYKAGSPVDILSVAEQFKKDNTLEEVGGPLYITHLSGRAVGGFQTEYHCKIILQKWMAREVIRIASEAQRNAFDETQDVQDIISDIIGGITGTMNAISSNTTKHISEVSKRNVEVIEKIMTGEYTLQGISTGISEIDEYCNGLQKSDLVIIAARTSMGKTSLMATLAYNIAVAQGFTTVVFSLEMSAEQFDMRLKILASEIESSRIYKGKIDSAELQAIRKRSEDIAASKLFIDDTAGLTLMEMRTKLKRISMNENIDVVFVDYLQLMRADDKRGRTRENEVSEISRGLKILAKEFKVPIVALSQLSRATEMSSDQRPKLHHLRESGSQEQDADQVWFIYRPYKVGIKEIDHESTYDKAEIIFAKHRNGPTGSAYVGFHEKIMKFMSKDKLGDTQLEILRSDLYEVDRDDNPF